MLSTWPIRNKLLAGLGLLLVIVAALSASGFAGLYSYRGLVKSLSWRVYEVPLTAELSQRVNHLMIDLAYSREMRDLSFTHGDHLPATVQIVHEEFRHNLEALHETVDSYRVLLNSHEENGTGIGGLTRQRETIERVESTLARIERTDRQENWMLDEGHVNRLKSELEHLEELTAELPNLLHENVRVFTDEARGRYRSMIVLAWIISLSTALMLVLFVRLYYKWVFRPLRVLIKGSRRVAAGEFDHQIVVSTHDEMSELANAMNEMTARFRDIRDDLDRQVQVRTRQVIRSEQLAGVGFLAAGVAHEINNPLTSIVMCAESLEGRVQAMLTGDDKDRDVVPSYLKTIQDEAFRCKEITERLLDFSRLGDVRRQRTELGELIQGVIEMVGHLGRYQDKQIDFVHDCPVVVSANPQEIKQVVLNLLTNALDSVSSGGRVEVKLETDGKQVQMLVVDNGCGMTPEVLEHLFEPFFTRKPIGQGTGLGLAISYRIVADHGGGIEAESVGPGHGATIQVTLPLAQQQKEKENRYQAA